MRQFFMSMFGTIIGIFVALFLLFIFFVGIIAMFSPKESVPDSVVLTMDLRSGMLDHGGENSLFGGSRASVVSTVRSLARAKDDEKVKGLFIRANGWGMAPAQAEELRLAIKDFQTGGKFVIAHAQGFEGTSLSAYTAVASADEIWLQDTTGFSLAGYRAEVEFLGGVFEKFDAKAEFVKFHEYKNAVNTYTEKTLNAPHREAMTALLKSLMDSSVANMAADRDMKEASILTFLEDAPHSAEQAKDSGFVDTLGHYAAARDYAKKKGGGDDATFQSVAEYGVGDLSGPIIAFIGGQGAVVTGESADGSNPFSNNLSMGSDTVSDALISAAEDDKVKAIVFRVNSPGGSPAASDQIWDAVERAKKAGKPVVISMGQYAASGGYYVAANSDKIVAMPSTITGSIGVFGGKFMLRDTFAKVGYNIEAINLGGEYSAAYSAFEPWSQGNREGYRRSMEHIYEDFTTRVATGRDLPLERVLEIAKGRVWTGVQAKEIGLVDELGGIMKAIEVAKELAEIDADKPVRIKQFPRPLSTSEQLEQMFNVTAEASASMEDLRVLTQSPEFKALIAARAAMENSERAQLRAQLPVIK